MNTKVVIGTPASWALDMSTTIRLIADVIDAIENFTGTVPQTSFSGQAASVWVNNDEDLPSPYVWGTFDRAIGNLRNIYPDASITAQIAWSD